MRSALTRDSKVQLLGGQPISDGVHRDGEAQLSRLRDGSAGLGQRSRLSR